MTTKGFNANLLSHMLTPRGGDYQNFGKPREIKKGQFNPFEVKFINFVRSTIALEICPLHDYMQNRVMDNSSILVFNRKNRVTDIHECTSHPSNIKT